MSPRTSSNAPFEISAEDNKILTRSTPPGTDPSSSQATSSVPGPAARTLSELTARLRDAKLSSPLAKALEQRRQMHTTLTAPKSSQTSKRRASDSDPLPAADKTKSTPLSDGDELPPEERDSLANTFDRDSGQPDIGGAEMSFSLLEAVSKTRRSRSTSSGGKAATKQKNGIDSDDSSVDIPLSLQTSATFAASPKRKKVDRGRSSSSSSASDVSEALSAGENNRAQPKRKSTKVSAVADSDGALSTKNSLLTSAMPTTKLSKPLQQDGTTTKAKGRPKLALTPAEPVEKPKRSRSTTKKQREMAVLPDYESWEKEDLQKETAKYGYKPAGTKKVLIGQLIRVWRALHPEEAAAMDAEEAASDGDSPVPADSRGLDKAVKATTSTRKKKPSAPESDDDGASAVLKPATSPKASSSRAKKGKKKAKSAGDDDVEVEEDERSAGERLRAEVLKDQNFYLRILRYEVRVSPSGISLACTRPLVSRAFPSRWLHLLNLDARIFALAANLFYRFRGHRCESKHQDLEGLPARLAR